MKLLPWFKLLLFFAPLSAFAAKAGDPCTLTQGYFSKSCDKKLNEWVVASPVLRAFVKPYEKQRKGTRCQLEPALTTIKTVKVENGLSMHEATVVFGCNNPKDKSGQSSYTVDISGEFGLRTDQSVTLQVLKTSSMGVH